MPKSCLSTVALVALIWATFPALAHAQYRNSSFGVDAGYSLLTQPSIPISGGALESPDSRPNRLARGFRVGGEGNFKLHHDHWWFDIRLALQFPTYGSTSSTGTSPEQMADYQGAQNMGTILGLGGLAGVRYYIWTDHVRPYVQVGLSYTHLWTFGSGAGATCADALLCADGGTYAANFLPHVNLLGAHVTPGVEFIASKDFAIHVIVDLERSLNFQAAANNIITFGLGVLFYS